MPAFVTIPASALTPHQRYALSRAPDKWKRLPASIAADAVELLKRLELIETDIEWRWSKSEPGAGKHVAIWRKAPQPTASNACSEGGEHECDDEGVCHGCGKKVR